jgi:hypothetical protein
MINLVENFQRPDNRKLIIMLSAMLAAIFCTYGESKIWFIQNITFFLDACFHELGHTIFGWLFGAPSFPVIIATFHMERSWTIQIIALVALAGICFYLWNNGNEFFGLAAAFSAFILFIAIIGYWDIVATYMGHGGAIVGGAFFLYKAWKYKNDDYAYRPWVVGYVGFTVIFRNIIFCYKLIYDSVARASYGEKHPFGMDNDFIKLSQDLAPLTVENIALFTIFLGIAAVICPYILAFHGKINLENSKIN